MILQRKRGGGETAGERAILAEPGLVSEWLCNAFGAGMGTE